MTDQPQPTGQTGRVTEADILRHGLESSAKAAEKLLAENNDLRKRVAELEQLVIGLERGEFICKTCGLRKDSEPVEADF